MFSNRKAAHIAAYFINRAGTEMYHLLLMKLIYIADRTYLERKGYAITGDNYCSMDNGPVLSKTYNLMNGRTADISHDGWNSWLSTTQNHKIRLLKEIDTEDSFDELSRAEMKVLDETYDQYGTRDRWELCNETHDFGEWQNPNGSSIPIQMEDIFIAQGRDREIAKELTANLVAMHHIDELLISLNAQ